MLGGLPFFPAGTLMSIPNEVKVLLDSLDTPQIIVRSDTTIAYANRAFRRRNNLKSIEGRHCHEVLFHNTRHCSACGEVCPMDLAMVSGKTEKALKRLPVPGDERFIDIAVTPLTRSDGRVDYFLETVEDRASAKGFVNREGLVIVSGAARLAVGQIARVAARDNVVLFSGPSGCGKETFARFLHENSRRASRSFVKIPCSGLTVEAFDREFFGRENGHPGLLDTVQGGTLYFDEVSDLSAQLLSKLLGLIETGRLRSTGSGEMRTVNMRVLCATRRNLADLVAQGAFPDNLYYRLQVCSIRIPRLEERREDIPDLARLILRGLDKDRALSLSDEALAFLQGRVWPGGVRELVCLVERAAILAPGNEVRLEDLQGEDAPLSPAGPDRSGQEADLETLARSWRGTRRELAAFLGVSERTLYRRLKEKNDGPE